MEKKFKVLFVYPNFQMVNLVPSNLAVLIAAVKKRGIDADLFDTTFYRMEEKSVDEKRVEKLQLRPFDLSKYGIVYKEGDVYEDFRKKVEDYKPDLIALTVVDNTVELTLSLLKKVSDLGIPTIIGGVHVILTPEDAISHDEVTYICWGEGEEALPELCEHLRDGKPVDNIKNIWLKKDGKIIKNQMRPIMDLDGLPYEDFDLFEEKRFFRPMQGKIFRMIPVVVDRGCPFNCTFCAAPYLRKIYRDGGGGNYYRVKSINRIIEEIKYLVKRYNIDYIYFNSETFMAMPDKKFAELADRYREEVGLPFWCQSRIETVYEFKIKKLVEMGCDRMSMGLEHGNEEFRKTVLQKHFTNEQVIKAFELLNKYKIPVTVNNMMGFPGETREMIFETIELNRKIIADSINGYTFTPYTGTYLREVALEKGYINKDTKPGSIVKCALNMPQLSAEEIEGISRCFPLYIKMPKDRFPEIRIAEKFTPEGNAMYEKLSKEYAEKYF